MAKRFDAERERTDAELTRREEELSFMATHDALTGLPNRTLILDRLEQMLARSARTRGRSRRCSSTSTTSRRSTTRSDTRPATSSCRGSRQDSTVCCARSDALGRLGGDEFVVICEELSPEADPELIAKRMLDALKPPFKLGPANTRV